MLDIVIELRYYLIIKEWRRGKIKITKGTRIYYEGKIDRDFTRCTGTITSVSQKGDFCTVEFDDNNEVKFDYYPTENIQTEANGIMEKSMVTLKVYKEWHKTYCA